MISAVTIKSSDRTLGAGALICHRIVVTAAHCVRGYEESTLSVVVVDDESNEHAFTALATVDKTHDLAFIRLASPTDELHRYVAATCFGVEAGDHWTAVPIFDLPTLRGTVSHPSKNRLSQEGHNINVLELLFQGDLGDYHGYSGGPVSVLDKRTEHDAIAGIILEQFLDRVEESRAAPILFAATMLSVQDAYASLESDILDALHLSPTNVVRPKLPSAAELRETGNSLREFRRMHEDGFITDAAFEQIKQTMVGQYVPIQKKA